LSRADVGLVKYLMRLQIPEIQENIIEIKDAARISGFKTKISVMSHQPGIEAVGTVIGNRGNRIKGIQDQLNGEHIEVFEYEDNFANYLVNVCSPAELVGYKVEEPGQYIERREITLITRPDKLALLIGKKGANVRLISDLLKSDIEIRTIDEAVQENIKYEKIEVNTSRQQTFKKTFNKYSSNADILSKYNTSKIGDISSFLTESAKEEKKHHSQQRNEEEHKIDNFGDFEE
jgi:N utilization substance protein A